MLLKSFQIKQKALSLTVSVVFMFTAVKTQVNIASKASIEICFDGSFKASVGASDGIRDKLSDIVSPSCSYEVIIAKFKEKYYIHYFVIHGERTNGSTGSITITCNKDLCGKYREKNTTGFQSIRVNNFLGDPKLIDEIGVVFHDGLLHLNELEIYTFASGLPGVRPLIYRGCFSKFRATKSRKEENIDSDRCIKTCTEEEVYIGLKEKECHCAKYFMDDEKIKLPEFYCNATCENWDKPCGGIAGFSVYLAYVMLPGYADCYETAAKSATVMLQTINDRTISKCLIFCQYLKFAAVKGKLCSCEPNGGESTTMNTCNTPCAGDPTSYCGGDVAWAYHKTCGTKIGIAPCSELFKCSVWDENGVCQGKCKKGFLGEHCIERDIDECVLNVCDEQKFDCENTMGSYICKVKLVKETGIPAGQSRQKPILLIITLILAWMQ